MKLKLGLASLVLMFSCTTNSPSTEFVSSPPTRQKYLSIEVPLSQKVRNCYALTDLNGTTLLKLKALLAGENPMKKQTGQVNLPYALNNFPTSQINRMCDKLSFVEGTKRVINLENISHYWAGPCHCGEKVPSCLEFRGNNYSTDRHYLLCKEK